MLSATFLDLTGDEIMTVGEVAIGDAYQDFCCQGHDWEVRLIFPDKNPNWNSIWGVCGNPDCLAYQEDIGPSDPYRGVHAVCQEDFVEWLAAQAQVTL